MSLVFKLSIRVIEAKHWTLRSVLIVAQGPIPKWIKDSP